MQGVNVQPRAPGAAHNVQLMNVTTTTTKTDEAKHPLSVDARHSQRYKRN